MEKEWAGLARSAAALLTPGGIAVFANNHRGGDQGRYQLELKEVFSEAIELGAPGDFQGSDRSQVHSCTYWCGPFC